MKRENTAVPSNRELALFHLAIDGKLRGCDLVEGRRPWPSTMPDALPTWAKSIAYVTTDDPAIRACCPFGQQRKVPTKAAPVVPIAVPGQGVNILHAQR